MPFLTGAGQAVDASVGHGTSAATSGHLRIDPDQLDGAIAVFQDALASVESEVRWARHAISAAPPAGDSVSADAAQAFNRISYLNENSAVMAWEGAVQQLRSIVQQLETAKQSIIDADACNASIFSAS